MWFHPLTLCRWHATMVFMTKADLRKSIDSYQAKHNVFRIVEVPKMQYLMVDGHGDPNTSQEFKNAILALYPVAYKLKFMSKQDLGRDYTVMPLEGLWWAEDMSSFTAARDKSQWDFTAMIMQPDWITREMYEAACGRAMQKNPALDLGKLRLEALDEGLCVQTLHVGSFDNEAGVLKQMHEEFIPANGLELAKKHHEVYFSDFRKVAPEKLKTLLRQPVVRAS